MFLEYFKSQECDSFGCVPVKIAPPTHPLSGLVCLFGAVSVAEMNFLPSTFSTSLNLPSLLLNSSGSLDHLLLLTTSN